MTNAATTRSLKPVSLADRLDELAGRFGLALAGTLPLSQLPDIREAIQDLRTEAENRGMLGRSRALGRIGLLTEVWECLATDPENRADEVGFFCAKALTQLARSDEPGDGGNDGIVDWILDHSTSTWGEYLALLEGQEGEDEDRGAGLEALDPSVEPDADASLRIDAQALIRLFQAGAAGDRTGTSGSSPPAFSVPVRPAAPVRPDTVPPVFTMPARPAAQVQPDKIVPALTIPALPQKIDLDEEIREAFLADASDLFERIEPLVLGLGRDADPRQSLRELGRCFHTLKGAAGSVGMADLATLVHALEEHLEETSSPASAGLIDVLYQMLGYLDGLIGLLRTRSARTGGSDRSTTGLDQPGADPPAPPSSNIDLQGSTHGQAPAIGPDQGAWSCQESSSEAATDGSASAGDGPIRVPASRFDELMDLVSELIARRRLWTAQAGSLKTISSVVRNCRSRMLVCLDRLHEAGLGRENRSPPLDARVDLPGQLRRLGELADDLVVLAETAQAAALPMADHGDALGRLTLQLWDELQRLRIVGIRGLFQRLARVAHDAARVEERQVDVVMAGEETGLDRAVQDKAFEPLLHVVRNAVGHGIESPEDRLASGKSAAGRITLEARREGNTLVVSVQDDGRGLNHEAIAAKARSLGLLLPDEKPSTERLNNMIFHPGFSTKGQANAISGRGVGMDVVAREVGLLKGTIELQTEWGRGTRLTIRLPARLALETAMIVRVDGQAFALPVAQIEYAQPLETGWDGELAGAESGPSPAHFVTFRDRRIPVIHARKMLAIACTPAPAWPKLLVVRSANGLVGLAVDSIEGTEDLVIKSLGTLLAGHPVISGTSLSVSGEVISILNPSGLKRWMSEGLPPEPAEPTGSGKALGRRPGCAVLVVDDSISVRRVIVRHLRRMGLDVDEASDGLEALGRLRSRPYRLVVTDLEMPRLDGFELLAELQRSEPLAPIPVIAASTKLDEETRRRVLALGARAFLAKPVDPTALAHAVSSLLAPAGG
ncbi:MAG: response regulator [Planctomycetaceae bacterium]|nr:response regulator [Planctomycetaceae bacterium]